MWTKEHRARHEASLKEMVSLSAVGEIARLLEQVDPPQSSRRTPSQQDAEGLLLAIAVVPASIQDRDVLPALDKGKAHWPSLREAIYDGAFQADRCREWSSRHGMRHHVVKRDPTAKGFVVLPRRWVVERSFGWLAHWNGLVRDRAGRLDVSAARITLVAILAGVEALLNPMPISHNTA